MSETAFVTLCLDTLTAGAVQSFIDIMYLSCEGSLTMRQLSDVKEGLVAAEGGRRMGDAAAVIASLSSLIDRFKAQGKLRIAVFFMERLLEIAKITGDAARELAAHHDLGAAREALGDDDAALLHHHSHRSIAAALEDAHGKALACQHLVRVYLKQGRRHEARGAHGKALELYLAALEAADDADDEGAQAETAFAAGRAYVMTGNAEAGVPLLQQYVR